MTLQVRASAFCSDGASAASPGSAAVASPATSTFSSASPQLPQLVVTSSTPHSPADMSSTVEENTTVDAGDRQNGPVPLNDPSSHVVNDPAPVREGWFFFQPTCRDRCSIMFFILSTIFACDNLGRLAVPRHIGDASNATGLDRRHRRTCFRRMSSSSVEAKSATSTRKCEIHLIRTSKHRCVK